MLIDAIDHVQLAMPAGGEGAAVEFYEGVLGIPRVPKPAELAARGGCWFERGSLRVHLGVDPSFVPAAKAHPAFAVIDLDAMAASLESAGVAVRRVDGPEGPQVYTDDPFGNRLEFRPERPVAPLAPGTARLLDVARVVDADLADRLAFVAELDRLKTVQRRTFIGAADRRENTAEHSWHVATMALVLGPVAPPGVEVARVVTMLLLHDVVEVDAGDTFVYDDAAIELQADRERRAADRLFGLLPAATGVELRAIWDEFEAATTPDARFAKALDRLAPLLLNVAAGGLTWRRASVPAARVRSINATAQDAGPAVEVFVDALLDRAESDGLLDAPPAKD